MPVCQCAQVCIFLAAGCRGLLHEGVVELIAPFFQLIVLGIGLMEHANDICISVRVPVRAQVLSEILYGVDVIIADKVFP